MKRLQKQIIKIMVTISILFLVIANLEVVKATNNLNQIQEQIENYTKNMDTNNITKEDILKVYDAVSEQYSLEDIADMIEENAEEIEAQGISKEMLSAGTNFIRTTDEKSIRNIIENDIDFDSIKEKSENGYTPDQILSSIIQDTSNEKKVEITIKLILANKIVKTVMILAIILFIYGTILRWIIYTKAGKHGFAAIIPLYRQIVMYQVCGLSPWLMLLWIVPIFGWIAMLVIAIMKRFCLAKEFGRGSLFGFGLLFLPVIFQSILAFNPNIQKSEKEV